MPVVTGRLLGCFVHFLKLPSLINQTRLEGWFLNHENYLEGCGTLRALNTVWLVALHMIQEI